MDVDKIHYLKEDMIVVFPQYSPIIYKPYFHKLRESEKRYNSLIYKTARQRANLRGTLTALGFSVLLVAVNWFLIWLTPPSDLFVISLAYLDVMYIRLAFVVIEAAFDTSFLYEVTYKGKIRKIVF